MRSLRRVFCLASVAGIWFGCAVNQAGLTDGGAVQSDAGTGAGGNAGASAAGRGGAGGVAGSFVAGVAGNGSSAGSGAGGSPGTAGGGAGAGGAVGAAGTGGSAGAAGTAGTSGAAGTTGNGGNGGNIGPTGGAGTTGSGGNGGNIGPTGGAGTIGVAGTTGSGGSGGPTGGAGTTGVAGTTGNGGTTGGGASGGRGGAGGGGRGGTGGGAGRGGTSGRGGAGGNPCAGYPSGTKSFVTPTDGRVHCYWTRSSSQTWSEASQSCMLQNGHLVTILSAEENAFVVSIAQFSTSFSDTWIGATDGKTGGDKTGAGTYRWVTNEAWGFTSWETGQPDGFCDPCSTGQTCTCDHRAALVNDGTWSDRWQDNGRSSVCEATPN